MNKMQAMNDMTNCNDGNVSRYADFRRIGIASSYLGIAVDLAKDNCFESAWYIISNIADKIGYSCCDDDTYIKLSNATKYYITLIEDRLCNFDEMYYQILFNKYAPDIIGDCIVVEGECDRYNIPDSWVIVDGDLIPVEIKLGSFNKKALSQLERYIRVFEKNKGIAVGKSLNVELPNNITFIQTSKLDELDVDRKKANDKDKQMLKLIKNMFDDFCNKKGV